MIFLFIHIEYIKLRDVSTILKVKDKRSAKKWLNNNGISISVVGGKKVVDKFSFEFKRQQLLVKDLIKIYPTKWFEIYDAKTEDKGMVKAISELYPKMSLVKKISKNQIKKYIK